MSKISSENGKNNEMLEFSVFNQSIEKISVGYGTFLMIWGLAVSLVSHSQSFTSLIPAIFGLFLTIFSTLALMLPKKKMLFMHIVVIIGLVIMLGGADFFRGLFSGSDPFTNIWAGSSKLMMFLTGGIFIFTCIRSFLFARGKKNRGFKDVE